MAYQSSYLTDEEKKKAQGEGAGVSTSGIVGGTATAVPGADSTTGSPGEVPKQAGTGFVNLAQYLDQNRGAGAKLAETATAGATQAADAYKTTAQKTLDEAKNKFGSATGADTAEKLKSGIVSDANANLNSAKDFLGSGFKGPSSNDYTGSLAADKNRVTEGLSKVDDQAFQQSQLESAYGKTGNYNTGFGLLDTFLLRGDQSGQNKINEVKGRTSDVAGTYDQTAQALQSEEQKARAALDQNKKSLVDKAAAEKAARENEANRKVQRINLELAKQKREGATNASLADVLDDNQIADLQALSDIANVDANYVKTLNPGTKPQKPSDPQPSSEGGFRFDPTSNVRYDAAGNVIPPDPGVGVARNEALPGGQKAPDLPFSTSSTWQAMPVTPVTPPPLKMAKADASRLQKQKSQLRNR